MRGSPVAVVLNPRAAGGRYGKLRIERLRRIGGAHAPLFVTEDRGLIDAVAEGVREREVRVVAVVGGDGTVSSLLSALGRAYRDQPLPAVALLRGGTMNTVANSLGVRGGRPEHLLNRLLRRAVDSSRPLPTLERATLRVESRLGFLFAGGVMAGFLQRLYDERPGVLPALSLLVRESTRAMVWNSAPDVTNSLDATLSIDGERHERREYLALGAGTVAEVGLGFRAFPRAYESSERFQLFSFTGSLRQLAAHLPGIYRGTPPPPDLGMAPLAAELMIESQNPILYALDGDLVRTGTRLTVGLGPHVQVVRL